MKRVDRLIIKARRAAGLNGERLVLAFIDHDAKTGKFIATGQLWQGAGGNGTRTVKSTHESIVGALDALDSLAAQYPNANDIPVIIDDIPAA